MHINAAGADHPPAACFVSSYAWAVSAPRDQPTIHEALRRYWGFEQLRPVQERAIRLGIERRDSLVVMPTGGGKSLCYQLPPLLTGRLTVVVSPLIALMKDQIDGLRLIGYPAAALYSGQEAAEQREVRERMERGDLRLLYLAPERLLTPAMLARLATLNGGAGPATFAIDEAHCISQWGHDFRPEYRRLRELREAFPHAAFNAFTATATPRVREDIVAQLGLRRPEVLVGVFDRPNLTYRVTPKVDEDAQLRSIIQRHENRAVIIYAISRKDTEAIAGMLRDAGIPADHYHAGLTAQQRTRVQENFAQERTNVIVATVAFGMGIDRSNVRCVVHAALPKSLEHYQQETGRAGRDGLPSECVLLYSGADAAKWARVIQSGAAETDAPPERTAAQLSHLEEMRQFAAGTACRHRFLSEHFGQPYAPPTPAGCGACDVCLGEFDPVPDANTVAMKIVSCVARMAQASGGLTFGTVHIANVLRGAREKSVLARGHDSLSTYGLLKAFSKPAVISFINQLLDAGLLSRAPGEYPTIALNAASWDLLRGTRTATLVAPREHVEAAPVEEPFDEALFEVLRAVRAREAGSRRVPAYAIFADTTLQDMTRIRPTRRSTLLTVRGVGDLKCREFGKVFAEAIAHHCAQRGLATDLPPTLPPKRARSEKPASGRKAAAFDLFRRRANIEDVSGSLGVAESTAYGYLAEFIAHDRPASISAWIDTATYEAVAAAKQTLATVYASSIREHLGGNVSYSHIRIALAHLRNRLG